ncbi:MAG: TraR/DksA family transcriptional regulator [Acidobacteriaceae bacterium]
METQRLEEFRKQLRQRQRELKRSLENAEQEGRAATADNNYAKDVVDQAADSYTKEFMFAQSSTDRLALSMVEGALDRLREGTFGQCVSCGKEINLKRMEAVPWTRHCIECQEKIEQGKMAGVSDQE